MTVTRVLDVCTADRCLACRCLIVCIPVAVLLCLPSIGAAGQDPFRQDVVVTAAATPVELGTVTRTLTVITREQIDRLPVHSIADVLRLSSSVDVRSRGERGLQTDFAVRGANFGQMLVLVDGIRLNDAQSGHHNGDIPVPLDAVERIEILNGPGSSLFGADAFGGTINIITRKDASRASGAVQIGSVGAPDGIDHSAGFITAARGQAGIERGVVRQVLSASVDRSSGFMIERGYATASVSSHTAIGERTGLFASYLWKDFGANGFYGNAPSHEWTNQTLVAGDHLLSAVAGWRLRANASYRTHGDHFIFDVRRPGVSENRHRSHATLGAVRGSHAVGTRGSVTIGVEGGADWIRSTNLGDHDIRRISAFSEWRHAPASNVQVDATLRVDRYTEFGTAWSPSLGAGWWPGDLIRLRASTGRAFRVPTFTERYYSDPANLARAEVGAERAWAGEAGADIFPAGGWAVTTTVFGRMDHDVIDWLRPTTADRWRTYNIRDVDTIGVELSVRKTLPNGSFLQAGYTALDVDAEAVTQLSKYVLDYAPHGLVAAASVALPSSLRVAPRLEFKKRTRSTGTTHYAVLDVRASRQVGRYELQFDATNLGGTSYQEVLGVTMPGRGFLVGIAYRR